MRRSHNNRHNVIMRKNKGVTMVELIVTFALLAIFMGAATMCISHAIIFFFDEQQRMSAYTVADGVISELKEEIRTMQGSSEGLNGYVKLRDTSDAYTGKTLEFITSNINDNENAVLIDAKGCNDLLINGGDNILREVTVNGTTTNKADLKSGYLTMRYYGRPAEINPQYKKLFEDKIVVGTEAGNAAALNSYIGQKVVWHAQEKLPESFYQQHKIELEFKVAPHDDGSGNKIVDYVDVIVYVKDENGAETVYQKERRVDLQNTVKYIPTDEATLYSDIAP